ncbi:hypothetical protein [Nocardia sp. NPDC004260]
MVFSIVLSLSALAVATVALWHVRRFARESADLAKQASGYADRAEAAADRITKSWDLPLSNTIHINTLDQASAATAVERVWRRRGMTSGR